MAPTPLRPTLLRLALGGALILPPALHAWTPGTGDPDAAEGFTVAATERIDVLAFYNTVYAASEDFAANMAWTGDVAAGAAGTTSGAFKDDIRRRINFFRALCGLPADIVFDPLKSAKDQAAALMFSANRGLSHAPPANWQFYSPDGAQAAGNSNIALGNYGPDAIDAYIRDDGANNTVVGHRRWLLYSRARVMGTGDVPETGTYGSPGWYAAANACWVIGEFKPPAAAAFVAWPNRGYCPIDLVPARWSLSHPDANFRAATVTLAQGTSNIPVTILSHSDTGYGDNTIVFEPQSLPAAAPSDIPFTVTVAGLTGTGVPATYTYNVTLFDPGVLGMSVAVAGPATPPTTGAAYTFTPVPQADAYELRVSTTSASPWTEGAEDATATLVQAVTTGSYPLRTTAYKRSGNKAFHLAFPDWNNQSFVVLRDLIPTADSQLQFADRAFFAATTTTLSAEVSTDNGNTWTSVWSRPGVGLSSVDWDPAFLVRSVSLSPYAGQLLRVRFILRSNNAAAVIDAADNCGFYVDDIAVTHATRLVDTATTALPGGATGFTLEVATAGAPLVAGDTYILRIRPQVGTRWFGDGPVLAVAPTRATGYAAWAAAQTPALEGGPLDDHDHDGLSNCVEYAFGLDPVRPTPASALPTATVSGDTFGFTFTSPEGRSDVAYAAQWSTDLVTWTDLPDTGDGATHLFRVDTAGRPRLFVRHVIAVAP